MDTSVILNTVLVLLTVMSVMWVVSLVLKDASIADPVWSLLFFIIAASSIYQTEMTPGKMLVLACVGLWGIRLSLHLLIRFIGEEEEDPRYQAFRRHFGVDRYWWVSYFQVFILQGGLAFIVSAPLQVAGTAGVDDPLMFNDWLGLVFFAVGLYFEVVGDWQLTKFKQDPAMKGKVLNTGLWRYTRHPNYFGDTCLWWGLWLMCLDEPLGLAAIVGPLLMSFLLMRVSGVPMLENRMKKTREGYEDYVKQTSSFFPRPPRAL
jgi:steroid 5-alpha reductase family enzyme